MAETQLVMEVLKLFFCLAFPNLLTSLLQILSDVNKNFQSHIDAAVVELGSILSQHTEEE